MTEDQMKNFTIEEKVFWNGQGSLSHISVFSSISVPLRLLSFVITRGFASYFSL